MRSSKEPESTESILRRLTPIDYTEPLFSVWCNNRIVHIAFFPPCGGGLAQCGTRVKSHWNVASGLMPFPDARLCHRCLYSWGFEVWRQSGRGERWDTPYQYRRKVAS